MGLAGSVMEKTCKRNGVPFVAEAFADRRYESDGNLRSRSKEGAVIRDAEAAASQVLSIITKNCVYTEDHFRIPLFAKSICIHGDNPAAVEILKKITSALNGAGIQKIKFTK